MSRDPHLEARARHHGYIGAGVALLGLVGILETASTLRADLYLALGLVGVLLLVDDLFQHWIQHRRPGFRSPVNRLWARIRYRRR